MFLISLGVVAAYIYIHVDESKQQPINVIPENNSYYSDQKMSEISKYREELRDFKPIEVPERYVNQDKSPLWDLQMVKTFSSQNINLNAIEVANKYKIEDINRELVYWHGQYKNLIKNEFNKESAKNAYFKYKIYKEAARIKSTQ